jgi:hypothetical protein
VVPCLSPHLQISKAFTGQVKQRHQCDAWIQTKQRKETKREGTTAGRTVQIEEEEKIFKTKKSCTLSHLLGMVAIHACELDVAHPKVADPPAA